jgi:membrane protein DedA with SNARE-associated domain
MVAQTQVKPTNGSNSPPLAVARGTGELFSDALTLVELQGRLLSIDVGNDLRRLIVPAVLLVSGAVMGLSCLPILLVALALGIMAAWNLAPWLAFLIALGVGAFVAAILLAVGGWFLRNKLTFLSRSRSQWQQNVNWFKSVVRRLGSTSSRPASPGY